MEIFDGHCDTISELLDQGKQLSENDLHIDMTRLSEYSSYTQFFAAFIAPEYAACAMERAENIISKFYGEMKNNNITVCKNYDDWKNAKTAVKAFLSLEGGEPVRSISDLHKLHKMGVSMIALTWNYKNNLACGVMEEADTGLTNLGKEVVKEMNRLGIIIDVSHLSEKSFWDVCSISKMPVCSSHSDLRAVKNHPRNLTDEQFLQIIKTDGITGINFYPPFLGEDIKDVVRHIDRALALGGEDNIGFGSDFDGVACLPRKVNGVQDMGNIIKMLPYTTEIREKIAFRNFLRVIKAHNC